MEELLMNQSLKEKLSAKDKWIRLLFMVLFVIVASIAKIIIYIIAIFQFITLLFTNEPNKMLLEFSRNLSYYNYQIFLFLTYNSEVKPFPFTAWPTEIVNLTYNSK